MADQKEAIENLEQLSTKNEGAIEAQEIPLIQNETVADREIKMDKIKEAIAQIPPVKEESTKKKGFEITVPKQVRRGMLAGLFTLSSLFSAKASGGEKEEGGAKTGAKVEASTRIAKEMSAVKGLAFYKGGIEKTPTGQNNAFENNPYGITKEDVYELAQKYNFHTDNNLNLQKDMYAYLESNRPDVLEAMHQAYGQTNAATFEDGILGSRTAFVVNALKTTTQTIEKADSIPEKPAAKEKIQKRVAFDKSYIINVRGDGNDGAYYVVENEAALQKIADMLNGGVANAEYRSNYGQLTIDMNKSVFLDNKGMWMNSPEKRALLGKTWHRDPKNPFYIIEDAGQENTNEDIAAK